MQTSRLIRFMLVACFFPSVAEAVAQERRSYTYSGLRFDEVLTIHLGGTTLHIPAGYLAPWPQRNVVSGPNKTHSIGFNFWMPSGRFVEADDLSIVGFQAIESGRKAAPANEYVVRIGDLRLLKSDELGVRSPELRFDNLTRGYELTTLPNQELGLLQVTYRERPNAFIYFRNLDKDPQFLLRCRPPKQPGDISKGTPGCDGYVYSAADIMSFYVMLPRDHLQDLRQILSTVRKLFKSWSEAQ